MQHGLKEVIEALAAGSLIGLQLTNFYRPLSKLLLQRQRRYAQKKFALRRDRHLVPESLLHDALKLPLEKLITESRPKETSINSLRVSSKRGQ